MQQETARGSVPTASVLEEGGYRDTLESRALAASSEELEGALLSDDRAEALRFWNDVSRLWPKSWWSPRQQWRDFHLRRYARRRARAFKRLLEADGKRDGELVGSETPNPELEPLTQARVV